MYMLFMGPPELDTEWQTDSIRGVKSFLNRLWAFLTDPSNLLPIGHKADEAAYRRFNRFLKAYQERLDGYRVNTAVASIMEYLNDLQSEKLLFDHVLMEQFLTAIAPMVPHFASELFEVVLGKQLEHAVWPVVDEALAAVNEIEIAVQINGKLRTTINTTKGLAADEVTVMAKAAAARWLEGKDLIKTVVVKDRLVSFVIK